MLSARTRRAKNKSVRKGGSEFCQSRAGAIRPLYRIKNVFALRLPCDNRMMQVEFGDTRCPQRFWSKIRHEDGCWIWTGGKSHNGYGRVWDGAKLVQAHRFSYFHLIGSFDPAMEVDHLCCRRD